jgi:hypothetical protein
MTTSQRLKLAVITALENNKPDQSISVVDAKIRASIDLPVLAVDVTAADPHSEALQHVERVSIAITLRFHAGDEEPDTVDDWIDQIESTLVDTSYMKSIGIETLKTYSWVYQGSTQDWDESILEVTFSAEALCSRFDVEPQHDLLTI